MYVLAHLSNWAPLPGLTGWLWQRDFYQSAQFEFHGVSAYNVLGPAIMLFLGEATFGTLRTGTCAMV